MTSTTTLRCVLAAAAIAAASSAMALPPGFNYQRVFEGLNLPTAVAFSRDGRVFVTEQRGVVKVFDSILDPTPDVFADLRTQVHVRGDRGLLGLALHPDFPDQPYVYVTYAYDGGIGADDAPRWGGVDTDSDGCTELVPNGGCPIGGRLSRLTAEGNLAVEETVLIEDWFQQFTFHSIGMPAFGSDGQLYVTGGEGAFSDTVDYGQFANPIHPDDGSPANEGGSLRVQDLETDGDPVGLSGTMIRVDPLTGAASPGNPLHDVVGMPENARRILAYGMRNPFRFAALPGTDEMWIADVGSTEFEEINRLPDPADGGAVLNFGWPCFEGPLPQPIWQSAELPICENLYGGLGRFEVIAPLHSYDRSKGDGSITGLAFYTGPAYPAEYSNALFYADFTGMRVYVMRDLDQDGVPDGSAAVSEFAEGADGLVDLKAGPGGDIFMVKLNFGDDPTTSSRVDRFRFGDNTAPSAALVIAQGSQWTGPARSITFDASGSIDPDSGSTDPGVQQLSFEWDLDGDGTFGHIVAERIFGNGFEDGQAPNGALATAVFDNEGRHTVSVRVTDAQGATDTASMQVIVGNTPPVAQILAPAAEHGWRSGTPLLLEADAFDLEDAQLPDSAYQWEITLLHCMTGPDDCHAHPQTGVSGRSGQFTPPGHAWPSYLSVQLTATDSGGLVGTRTLELAPETTVVTMATEPPGLSVAIGSNSAPTPYQHTLIVGSSASVSAPSTQESGGSTWQFSGWSNGQPRLHTLVPDAPGEFTLTATYTLVE